MIGVLFLIASAAVLLAYLWFTCEARAALPPEEKHFKRLVLTHADGTPYLKRWAFVMKWFRIYLHRIDSGDPGVDPHDHPWAFTSIILKGGYYERVISARGDVDFMRTHRAGSVHRMRLDMAHHITWAERGTWTLVIGGRFLRPWGFYVSDMVWVPHDDYSRSNVERRPLTVRR